jgi:hypothetical protein
VADYPSSIWSGNTRGTNLSDAETHTDWHDDVMDEVIALETELGTNPSGGSATVTARLNALDSELGANPSGTFTDVVSRLNAIDGQPAGGTYTSIAFTPLWTNLNVNDGTVSARYAVFGPLVYFYIQLIFGASSAVTGNIQVSISGGPPPMLNPSNQQPVSSVTFFDNSATEEFSGTLDANSSTQFNVRRFNDPAAGANNIREIAANANNPFTFGTLDRIEIRALYLAA